MKIDYNIKIVTYIYKGILLIWNTGRDQDRETTSILILKLTDCDHMVDLRWTFSAHPVGDQRGLAYDEGYRDDHKVISPQEANNEHLLG